KLLVAHAFDRSCRGGAATARHASERLPQADHFSQLKLARSRSGQSGIQFVHGMKIPPIQNTMFGFGNLRVEEMILSKAAENMDVLPSRFDSLTRVREPAGPELGGDLQPTRNRGDPFLKEYFEV